jgi:thioredoxin reductase
VVLEQASQCGGMLCCNPHRNDWLLGFPDATGLSIREQFLAHLARHDFPRVTAASINDMRREGASFVVTYSEDEVRREIAADFLVIATGTRPRLPSELAMLALQFPERIIVGAGELIVDEFATGQRVAMLGGGDNAFENACHLAERGVQVDIYCRGAARARREWQNRCSAAVHTHTVTRGFAADHNGVTFRANDTPVRADAVVVMYGYAPNTDALVNAAPWLGEVINDEGFVVVDAYQRTKIAHLYAIGDVTDRPFPSLPSAIGQGSVAAKAIVAEAERTLLA